MDNPYKTLSLERLIEICTPNADCKISDNFMACWLYYELCRLKELDDSAIRAADKYLKNTPREQFVHVVSENEEELKAFSNWLVSSNDEVLRKEAAMELIDGQMSRQTMLRVLGYSEKEILQLRKGVIAKNKEREYYDAG